MVCLLLCGNLPTRTPNAEKTTAVRRGTPYGKRAGLRLRRLALGLRQHNDHAAAIVEDETAARVHPLVRRGRSNCDVNPQCEGYARAACGMASINARKALLTASGVVNTLDTSGSKATTTQD